VNRVIIIQARMTSTRLPGKVLMEVSGQPMLAHQIRRLQHCRLVDRIVVATTTNLTDDPVVALAHRLGVAWFRGSETDVLGRLVGAALQERADLVIRVTADCPLIDPWLTDQVIQELSEHATDCDYVCNFLPQRTFPRGLDVEAFFTDVLLRVDRLGQSSTAREHVTTLIYSERPELFLRRQVVDRQDNSDLRWTVDTEVDLRLIRLLYEALGLDVRVAPYQEVLAHVRAHPELAILNATGKTRVSPLQKDI
jgi:spore coat polysaccharide biosynthesis protein SpsF